MTRLPLCEHSFEGIAELFFAGIRGRVLMTGLELKVFDRLMQPASASDLAVTLSTHPGNTELLLDGLTAIGLLEKERGRYCNRPIAQELLVSERPAYLGDWLTMTAESYDDVLNHLTDIVRNGPPPPTPDSHMNDAVFCERFTAAHAATSLAGAAQCLARCVSELEDFGAFRTMLDLGGGPGVNTMAVIAAHPHLHATVYDRPAIVRMARNYIDAYGFADRIDVQAGDYLSDPVGQGYDFILVSDTLYYDPEQVDGLLNKLRDALTPQGVIAAIHAVLTDEGTRPEGVVLGLLPQVIAGQGGLPEYGFLADAMRRCGFCEVTSRMVDMPMAPMELNVCRKPH